MKSYVRDILQENASNPNTEHDFGKDIIPMIVERGEPIYAYDFRENKVSGQTHHYWRDVGTIKSLWEGNMDLIAMEPKLNIYNKKWRIRTPDDNLPMAKMNSFRQIDGKCSKQFTISGGSIVEDSYFDQAILGRDVRVYGSEITESVIFSGVHVRDSLCRRAIIDEGVEIPAGTRIGVDHEEDRSRGLFVDDSGIVVVPKGFVF